MTQLYTPWADTAAVTPWQCHPRPQLRRDGYVNLNGSWKFRVTGGKEDAVIYDGSITVPFCPESALSGIGQHFPEGSLLHYSRSVTLPHSFSRGRLLLHIGAADQHLRCLINGRPMGAHSGGYEAMTFDITDAWKPGEENLLELTVRDDLKDLSMPYGKQVLPEKRGGMWYTPVSGIWQTVWLESVPLRHIRALKIDVSESGALLDTLDPADFGTVTVQGLGEFPLQRGKARITPENPRLWSPEDPYLYEFTVQMGDDRVHSYFALRTLDIRTVEGLPRLCLNGKPYFFHGLLDQGYWPDGLFTPAHPDACAWDIQTMKSLGFNTLRKHIKVEPEEFYYQCDRLGMVVFQDMVNNGDYSFLRDTALPTAGIQTIGDKKLHRNKKCREEFLRGMEATVRQLGNHPCICCWTIFNEGWGQFDSDNVYRRLRRLDASRFIDSTSGWFRQALTDVDSRHVYFRPLKPIASDKPLVVSEFGGYSCKLAGHSFNPDQTYGYGKFEDPQLFRKALEALYLEQVLPLIPRGLCAAIYTQVSDVEDETNGLVTYDRRVIKPDAQRMRAIAGQLCQAIAQTPNP